MRDTLLSVSFGAAEEDRDEGAHRRTPTRKVMEAPVRTLLISAKYFGSVVSIYVLETVSLIG